jgi:hypothetical protein
MFDVESVEISRPYLAAGKHLVTVDSYSTGTTSTGNTYIDVIYHSEDYAQLRHRYIFSERSAPVQLGLMLRQVVAARGCSLAEAKELLSKASSAEELGDRFLDAMKSQKLGVVVYNKAVNGRVFGNLDETQFSNEKNFGTLEYDPRNNQVAPQAVVKPLGMFDQLG